MSETKNSCVVSGYKVSKTICYVCFLGNLKLLCCGFYFITRQNFQAFFQALYIATVYCEKISFLVLFIETAFLNGEKRKKAFTQPRTKEDFVFKGEAT